MNLPDFLIIGETKCGTTSLFNYLIDHPKIKNTLGNGDEVDESYATKEIRFFDRYYDRGLDWYKGCFPRTEKGELVGEATPMYMYRAMVPFRIKKIVPNCKFIILLRNPIDRLYSNFQHYYKWVPGFDKQYSSFENYIDSCNDRDYFMIDKGIYYLTLSKWFDLFPMEQFVIETTESLYTRTQEVYSRILGFLGMEDYKIDSFKKFRENNYSHMNPETRKNLQEFYEPYNKKLEQLLDRKFDWK